LALFVSALYQNDQQFVALNDNLAEFTDWFTKSDHDVGDTVKHVDDVLGKVRKLVHENRSVLAHAVNNVADATTTLLQPEPRDGIETGLHVLPNFAGNFNNIYHPTHGSLMGLLVFPNFANPMQFICSAIQAGSRLGYQDSAELCAQYLAPVLDAIKFNYPPAGMNLVSTAATLPKEVAYSEERLRPPPGYKDTTVPGIFSPDTPFSHRNSEPGWVVAPGMQGTQVQPLTANMLTPDSLAELMGGPDIAPPQPEATMSGPPNAYDESNPPPPPWYPPAPSGGGR
ncbi:MAG TPA: mammalian cell entry protein, partial [Mycobacterium sp.]|nr:mammalian cell entry protein [Mycobacterium sp.]